MNRTLERNMNLMLTLETRVGSGAGDDTIVGGTGSDWMGGGSGDDRLLVDPAGDVVVEAVNGGQDEVQASIDYTDGEDGNDQLFGGALADVLFGFAGNNSLYGDDITTSAEKMGDDTLDGEAGDDQLQGGVGLVVLYGGAGEKFIKNSTLIEAANNIMWRIAL